MLKIACLKRIFCIIFLLYLPIILYAQPFTVSGHVIDPWGTGIRGAIVTAQTDAWQDSTATDRIGFYKFENLRATVENAQFQTTPLVSLRTYPNPVTHYTRMQIPQNSRLFIYNILGQEVGSFTSSLPAVIQIDMSGLASGIYLAKLYDTDDKKMTRQLNSTRIVHLGRHTGNVNRAVIQCVSFGQMQNELQKMTADKFDVDFIVEKSGYFSNKTTKNVTENLINQDLILLPPPTVGFKNPSQIILNPEDLNAILNGSGFANENIGRAYLEVMLGTNPIYADSTTLNSDHQIPIHTVEIPKTLDPGTHDLIARITQTYKGQTHTDADTLKLFVWGMPDGGLNLQEGVPVDLSQYFPGAKSITFDPYNPMRIKTNGSIITPSNTSEGSTSGTAIVYQDGVPHNYPTNVEIERMTNFTMPVFDFEDLTNVSGNSNLILKDVNSGEEYSFTAEEAADIVGAVPPGTYAARFENSSSHDVAYYVLNDGQRAVTFPSYREHHLNLGEDLEGKIFTVNKEFRDDIYHDVWGKAELRTVPTDTAYINSGLNDDGTPQEFLSETLRPMTPERIQKIKNFYLEQMPDYDPDNPIQDYKNVVFVVGNTPPVFKHESGAWVTELGKDVWSNGYSTWGTGSTIPGDRTNVRGGIAFITDGSPPENVFLEGAVSYGPGSEISSSNADGQTVFVESRTRDDPVSPTEFDNYSQRMHSVLGYLSKEQGDNKRFSFRD